MGLYAAFVADKHRARWGWGMSTGDFQRSLSARLGLLALVAAIALAGCSSDPEVNSEPEATPPTTAAADSVSSTTAASTSREEAVVAGYRAHWDAWYAAAQIPDPNLPSIPTTMWATHLEGTRAELARMRDAGERIKGDPGVPPIDIRRPRVVQFQADTTAILADCFLDNTVRYDAEGEPIGETEPTFFSATAAVVLVDGNWKVASLQLRKNACRA